MGSLMDTRAFRHHEALHCAPPVDHSHAIEAEISHKFDDLIFTMHSVQGFPQAFVHDHVGDPYGWAEKIVALVSKYPSPADDQAIGRAVRELVMQEIYLAAVQESGNA